MINSSLVTFREPDEGDEKFGDDVKRMFYEALAQTPADEQIIIIDNRDLPAASGGNINYVQFTKSRSYGRHGFFEPVAASDHVPEQAPDSNQESGRPQRPA